MAKKKSNIFTTFSEADTTSGNNAVTSDERLSIDQPVIETSVANESDIENNNPWRSSNAFENGVIPPAYEEELNNLSSNNLSSNDIADDFAIDALFSLACSSVEKSRWISERLGVRVMSSKSD